jgi:seryl-tRNA synthetase
MALSYKLNHGVFQPDFELSELERSLFREFEDLLRGKNFKYLAVPESVETKVLYDQGVATNEPAYWLDGNHFLNGSAEQGVLNHFAGKHVSPMRIYALTHCYRREDNLYGLVKLKEFKKIEQFAFCDSNWKDEFEVIFTNATDFLRKHGIEFRILDVTSRDSGYHVKKFDIEIETKEYGWVESHSCTYFGDGQAKRLGITGATHTMSNTGIASPRILIPFIERQR